MIYFYCAKYEQMKMLKIRILFLLLFLTSNCLYAQNPDGKAETLSYSSPGADVERLNNSIASSVQSEDYFQAATDLISVARAYKLQGNFDEALFKLFYAREIITIHLQQDAVSDLLMGECLETIGEIYYFRFMEKRSEAFYFESLRYFMRALNFQRVAGVLQLLVESELAMGDTVAAKKGVESLQLLAASVELSAVKAHYFTARAALLSSFEQPDSAIIYYENAWKIFKNNNDVLNASKILGFLAENCIGTGDYQAAIQWSEKGVEYNTRNKNTGGYFEMVYYKAFATGFFDINVAITIAEDALDSISKTKYLFHEGVFYSLLVNANTGHDADRALFYMQKYLDTYKNVYGMASEQRIAEMTLKVFTDRMNIRIENLNTQERLNERIRNGQRNMIFFFVIALLVLLIVTIGNLKKLQFRLFLFRDYMSDLMPLPVFFLAFELYFFLLLAFFNSPDLFALPGFSPYLHLALLSAIPSIIATFGMASFPAKWSNAPKNNRSFSTVAFSGLLIINISVVVYLLSFGLIEFSLFAILNAVFTFTGLIVVPLFFMVIYIEKVMLRKHIHEAGLMNTRIRESAQLEKPSAKKIRIVSDKSKDVFESDSTDLLLVEGQSNYTKFYFIANGSLKTTLLLMTLKQAESQLQDYREFIRCHKSNIVNLTRVKKVKGNSHGYKLSVPPIEEPVTVSKSFISEFNEAFNRFSVDAGSSIDE